MKVSKLSKILFLIGIPFAILSFIYLVFLVAIMSATGDLFGMVDVILITFGFVGWYLLGKHAVKKSESKIDYYTKWISLAISSGWFLLSFISNDSTDLILNPIGILICMWCALVTLISVIFIGIPYADNLDTP